MDNIEVIKPYIVTYEGHGYGIIAYTFLVFAVNAGEAMDKARKRNDCFNYPGTTNIWSIDSFKVTDVAIELLSVVE